MHILEQFLPNPALGSSRKTFSAKDWFHFHLGFLSPKSHTDTEMPYLVVEPPAQNLQQSVWNIIVRGRGALSRIVIV